MSCRTDSDRGLGGRGSARLAASLLALGLAAPAWAVNVSAGVQQGVHIQNQVQIPNDTGQDANDLHLRGETKEIGTVINGVAGSAPDWGQGQAAIGGNGFAINLSDGFVPAGGSTTLDLDFWLNQKNRIFIDYTWTFTENGVTRNLGGGKNGWDIQLPLPGEGVGGPGNQGGGGGSGSFIHRITIFNDKDVASTLQDLNAYATMTRLASPADLDWTPIPSLIDAPLVIPALSSVSIDFETTGSYLDGFVYFKYVLDDPFISVGVHPVVDVPEPAAALLMLAGLGALGLRRR